ncbi:MAG: FAD-dependent oxidoreductase, partial [Chloroflexi bacterium]|nr:FAD-dependent oxidoreductase [Chloroflexota bacterium]
MNVIAPQMLENLSRTLARASADGVRVSPRGGNTALGNGPRRNIDLQLEMTQLRQVVEYEPANLTISVEAGLTLAALQ